MISKKLLEKLRVVQVLVNQIAEEEVILTGTEYEVWSPYDTPGAAAILMEMLEKDRQQNERCHPVPICGC